MVWLYALTLSSFVYFDTLLPILLLSWFHTQLIGNDQDLLPNLQVGFKIFKEIFCPSPCFSWQYSCWGKACKQSLYHTLIWRISAGICFSKQISWISYFFNFLDQQTQLWFSKQYHVTVSDCGFATKRKNMTEHPLYRSCRHLFFFVLISSSYCFCIK